LFSFCLPAAICCILYNRRFSWAAYFAVNWFIIIVTLVTGLGFGGYASVNGFVTSLHKFGFFAKCYNC
jgi:auxin influx carrier (AUX1 LAX family)